MNIDVKIKKEKRNTALRWIVYGLMLAVSYIYMTTAPFGWRTPLFVIPIAMCISMFEEPFESAVAGCVAGLLLDAALGTLIGLNGIIMLWCCLISSLLFVIPIAMCISMFEEPFESAVAGCVAGLLLDAALGTLIGLNGIIMLWCCLISSLLFHFFMRRYIVNIILLNAAAIIVQTLIHYLFYYAVWEYDSSGKILTDEFVPVMIYTEIAVLPFYFAVKFLVRHLGLIREDYIEEKSDDIVRE